jgi:predicted  nucleic acid-binding Zn-ribbon protein
MSNCKIFRNNDGSINKVFDELGNESQLYQDTLFHVSTLVDNIPMTPPVKHYLDKGDIMDTSVSEIALGLWAYSYSDHFRNKYNITKSKLEEVSVDDIVRHIEEYYPKPVVQETITVEQPVIKEGVEELFNSNPELSTIGTQEQYSQYLDTIFPDSKVKDIVYRGGSLGVNQPENVEAFTTSKVYAEYRAQENNTQVYPAILNIKDSKLVNKKETRTLSLDRDELQYKDYGFTDNKDQTKQLGNFYTVKENNRYILGSNNDIEGFKKFVGSNVLPEQRVTNEMLDSNDSKYPSDIFINTFKESIAKILESNPELADKIYEKFAFVLNDNNENNIIIKEFNRIKKSDEYELLDEELNTILKLPDGYIDESLNKFKIIAKILKDKLQEFPIKVYYKEDEKKDRTLGVYSEYFQTIVMYDNKNITSKISTLLHEATHALTLGSLIKSELGITDKKFYDSITSYRQIVSEEIKKKGYPPFTYQLSNNDEFLAAVFSEHEFRDILKSIPSTKKDNKTLWEDILDLIKELIGIDGKNTILEDIINDTLDNLQDFKIKKVNVLMNLEQKRKAQELYSQYLEQKSDKNDLSGFTEFIRNSLLLETPTYNPETKSKTALLEEFNKLIEVSEKMGTKYPPDAINKIKSFLQELNFDLSTVDEVLARRGLTDKPKAVIDFAYNMIAFADGATVEDFAEEIGHIITLHAPQDRDLELALEAIKDTQIYKDNYLDYVKTYSKPGLALEMSPERKAALEILGRFYGKLLTGTLTENDMKISKQPFFTRIMNAIKNFINGNFNLRTYLERNRENFFLEPGKEIKSKEIFYSLEQSEKITYSKMTNAIEKMTKSLKSRMSRTYKDDTAPLGEYSKRLSTLQTQLDQVYKMKENLAYDSAYADFLKSLYVDTTNVFNFLEKYFNFSKTPASVTLKDVKFSTQDKIFIGKDETVDSSIIENNESNVIYTKYKLLNLKSDADLSTLHYSQLSELREFLVYYDNFIREMGINNVKDSIIDLDPVPLD